MKKVLIVVFLFSLPFINVEAGEKKPYELPRTQIIPIQDSDSKGQYELYIKLPEKYSKNNKSTYPVIYIADAVWHIEILSASTEFLIEDAILVGISWQKDIDEDLKKERGAHVSRYRDYSIKKPNKPDGQAANHLAFIRNDVIQYIESNYRADPDSRTYFGYSLSGLFGAYILLRQPDTFQNYILGSPSIWSDNPYLAKLGANAALKRKGLNANVFISYGSLEKKLSKHVDEFIALLKNREDESLSLQHEVIEGSHQTAFPMTGVRSVTWLSDLIKERDK